MGKGGEVKIGLVILILLGNVLYVKCKENWIFDVDKTIVEILVIRCKISLT